MAEIISIAILLVVVGVILAFRPIQDWMRKPALKSADYVIFKAQPSLLPDLQADLSEAGWRWVSTMQADDACLYRFEKNDSQSVTLARIWNADGVMQRTANRKVGSDLMIKVESFGSRRNLNAQTH